MGMKGDYKYKRRLRREASSQKLLRCCIPIWKKHRPTIFQSTIHSPLHAVSVLPLIVVVPSHSLEAMSSAIARVFRTTGALRAAGQNPLQSALRPRAQQQFLSAAARCYATAFSRDLPHVNIGTIGHVDHGKVCRRDGDRDTFIQPRDGKEGVLQCDTNLTCRPLSQPPSPSDRQKRAMQAISSMAPSTRPPKSESVESPSRPLTSNTKPTSATTHTSIALVTPITSRT